MNGYALQVLPALLLATLGLTVAALVTWCLLRYSRAVSPRVHRLAWCAVLLVGWSFARLPIEVPWYDPVPPAELAVNLDEPLSTLSIAQPNEEVIEAPAGEGIIELSGTYEELSPEPVASAAGADPPIELSVTPELPAPILAEIPTVALVPPAAVTKLPEQVVRSFWTDIDPWLTLTAFWAAGIGATVLAWLAGYLWFILRSPVGRAADPRWLDEWQSLRDSRGVRRSIPLRVTLNFGPMLCRLPGGYTLVVPEPLWRELDESGRRAILRHELAHYERGDVWWSLLARVLALPNWFNPASWYCVRKFDEAAEWACDRAATADQPVTDYAKALLRLGTDAHGYASYRPAAAGKPLAGRIRRLLRLRNERDSKIKAALLIAAALVMATAALVQVELVARAAPEAKIADAERQPQPVDTPERIGPLDDEGAVPGPLEGEVLGTVDEGKPQRATEFMLAIEVPATQTKVRAAAQAAAEAAEKAYVGNLSAYVEGRATLDAVYAWSLRWMNAAEQAPTERQEMEPPVNKVEVRLAAAQQHLVRMKDLRTRVKALFDIAARGGEGERMADANFYVAEAERIVAEREANFPRLSGALEIDAVPQPKQARASNPTPATPVAQPTPRPTVAGGAAKVSSPLPADAPESELTVSPSGGFTLGPPGTNLAARQAREASRNAAKEAVEIARRGYEAHKAAYENGTATLGPFLVWSERWLRAAERVAENDEERKQAAQAHLERTIEMQKRVKALHDSGILGGEEEKWQEINFYVAEAKRKVAELEAAQPTVSGTLSISPQPAVPAATLTPTPSVPAGQPLRTPDVIGPSESTEAKPRQYEQPLSVNPTIAPTTVPASTPAPVAAPVPTPTRLSVPTLVPAVPAVPQSGLTVDMTVDLKGADYVTAGETVELKIAVANKGRARFSQVKVAVKWDGYLQPVAVTDGYAWQDQEIIWLVDELPAGKTLHYQLNCRVAKNLAGTTQSQVTVTTREGTRAQAWAVINSVITGGAEVAPTLAPGEDPFAKLAAVPTADDPFGNPSSTPSGRAGGGRAMGGGGRPLEQATDSAVAARKFNLRYDGKRYDEWRNILTTELSDEGQFKAIDALGAFAAKGYGGEVANVLLGIRPEPRSGLSVRIVNALLKIPKEIAVPHLATAGKSDDEVTRRLALIALANAAPTSAETKAALKSALHDASPIVVEAAINLMGAGTHEKYYLAETRFPAMPELAPDLAELLSKLNQNRTEAGGNLDIAYLVNALELCGPAAKVAFPTVIPWLASEDWNTRVRAFSIIGAVGAEAGEALPALIALLKESPGIDAQRRASSLEAGRMGGGGQSLTAITLATLAKIGPPAKEAVPTILESVKHTRDQDDLEAAINALEAIGPLSKEAVPLLIRAFGQHPISMMKKLGQIGPDAEEAIPLLKQFAENAEIAPEYSEAARESLKKIQPEAK